MLRRESADCLHAILIPRALSPPGVLAMIVRLPGSFPTRCRAVVHNGVATLFAIAPVLAPSMYNQTKAALAAADATLAEAGSSKDRILTATVFIADMTQKDEMNRAWDEWADRHNPPMRVCVSVGLTGACLVEMLITAVVA
jgi:enamine deaminase RidA (YjgF/YER057c/UK114 family)